MSIALVSYSTEDLEYEIARRKNEKLLLWKQTNVSKNKRLSTEVIDFIAPEHSKRDFSDCNKLEELSVSGYSRCNRCSLEAMRQYPDRFAHIRMDFTVDFTTDKQTSFK